MTILSLDFMNAAHRARSGFKLGPAPVVFNFFRQFKSLVDKFKPNRVYVVLEGKPTKRKESLAEYKANRIVGEEDPRIKELQEFFKQKDVILDLLKAHFPVSVVRHPTSEADDTISNLICSSSSAVDWVIVSSDTDFIQLLHDRPNVRLFNPIKNDFIEAPEEYDYVTWKSLRGDSSDNIPGIPGIGDKTAAKIASDPIALREFINRPDNRELFSRNYNLIRFQDWNEEERLQMTSSFPTRNWFFVRETFEKYGFNSIVKEDAWQKFTSTFDKLWGPT